MRRRAFTLIELLVVVAIIAILAAILFPVFARAREKAKQAGCQSNLKQIVAGLQMYSQDYDERLCPARIWGKGGVDAPYPDWRTGVWDYLIQPYVKAEGIFTCPSFAPRRTPIEIAAGVWANTYGMNYRLTQFSPTTLEDQPHLYFGSASMSDIRRPAETAWITDSVLVTNPYAQKLHQEDPSLWQWTSGAWNPEGLVRFPQDPPGNYKWYFDNPWRPGPIHNHGTNVAFLDGHVKWYKTDQLVNPPRSSRECLYDNGP